MPTTTSSAGRVARPQRTVPCRRRSGTAPSTAPSDGEQPVLPRHVIARRTLECRKRQEREEQAEREVDRARFGVVEQAEPEARRQRERNAATRTRAGTTTHGQPDHQHHVAGEARGRAPAEVRVLDRAAGRRFRRAASRRSDRSSSSSLIEFLFELLACPRSPPRNDDGRPQPPVGLYAPAVMAPRPRVAT